MKRYRDSMNELSFSPEQKQRMAAELLEAAQAKPHRRPRRVWVAAVAALLACVVTACATGGLQSLALVLANILDPDPTEAQTQTLQQLFTPIGLSDTDNGVTVTAEGIIGDLHNVAILYSIRRDNGEPLIQETEDTKNISNGDNTLLFEAGPDLGLSPAFSWGYGSDPLFLDFTLSDSALYFLDLWTFPADQLPTRNRLDVTLKNLYSLESVQQPNAEPMERTIPLVNGTWSLSGEVAFEEASFPLPAGQTFTWEDLTGTITDLRLSPLSLHIEYDYTADRAAIADRYDPEASFLDDLTEEQWVAWEIQAQLTDAPITLTFTDGSTRSVDLNGSLTEEGHAVLSGSFGRVCPPDTIESITIRGVTIPVGDA